MPMHNKGLTKLQEECAELIQIAAKKSAFMSTDLYPDGTDMTSALHDEIADVLAAIEFVVVSMALNANFIEYRKKNKLRRYNEWNNTENMH